jgi:hypothetical protein
MRAWGAAGRYAAAPHPRPFGLGRGAFLGLPPEPNAVYAACGEGETCYVGSTTRGVATRLAEHLRAAHRSGWEELWVVGLRNGLSPYQVRLAEERVGRVLKPCENLRPPGR